MALKKCKECGNQVSTKADKCPNCGAPIKKKIKVGCFGTIFILIIVSFSIVQFVGFFEKRSEEKKRVEQQKISVRLEKKKRIKFINNLEQHYEKLASFYNSKNFDKASKELKLFKKYNKRNYKDVGNIEKGITIFNLEKKVKSIPVAKSADNLRIYKQLLNLDPDNQKYKKKVAFYQAKVSEQRQKEEKARIAAKSKEQKSKVKRKSKKTSYAQKWKALADNIISWYGAEIISIEQLNGSTCWVVATPNTSIQRAVQIAENVGYFVKNNSGGERPSVHVFVSGKHIAIARPSGTKYIGKIDIDDWEPSIFKGKYKPK